MSQKQKKRLSVAKKLEREGDYGAATQQLEHDISVSGGSAASGVEIANAEEVRSRVVDLTRLAEMKWRYRVVDVGESALNEALEHLSQAKDLLDGHRASTSAEDEAAFRTEWAAELSAVLHAMGVARVIFNTDREERPRDSNRAGPARVSAALMQPR